MGSLLGIRCLLSNIPWNSPEFCKWKLFCVQYRDRRYAVIHRDKWAYDYVGSWLKNGNGIIFEVVENVDVPDSFLWGSIIKTCNFLEISKKAENFFVEKTIARTECGCTFWTTLACGNPFVPSANERWKTKETHQKQLFHRKGKALP